MKKVLKILLTLICLIIIIFTPFYIIQIKNRTKELIYKNEYKKTKFKIDSLAIESSNIDGPSNAYRYEIYYNDNRNKIELVNDENTLIVFEPEKEHLNHFLKTEKNVGDSILIWHHKSLEDKYAKEDQKYIDTGGYSLQIIINTILLGISAYGIRKQIIEWRKPKKK